MNNNDDEEMMDEALRSLLEKDLIKEVLVDGKVCYMITDDGESVISSATPDIKTLN